jgi:hypothetical protein
VDTGEGGADGAGTGQCGLTYSICVDTFSDYDPEDVSPSRELVISEAYQDMLVVEPRSAEDRRELSRKLECCFPQGIEYRVRVQKQWVLAGSSSGLRSNVTARETVLPDESTHFRCELDCDPKKTYWRSRVFEIAARADVNCASGACAVGPEEPGDPCVYDPCEATRDGTCTREGGLVLPSSGVTGDLGAISCIHSGITSRFAIYRGLSPSVRGMMFTWQTTGGFRTLLTSIASVSVVVMPQTIEYVPELQAIAIVDGAQLGLTLVSIDTLRVEDPWPVY